MSALKIDVNGVAEYPPSVIHNLENLFMMKKDFQVIETINYGEFLKILGVDNGFYTVVYHDFTKDYTFDYTFSAIDVNQFIKKGFLFTTKDGTVSEYPF